MSDVEFDTDMNSGSRYAPGISQSSPSSRNAGNPSYGGQQAKGMAGWLMRHGLAKSPQSAEILLVVVVIVDIIATFAIIKYFLL
jgi:hypothetical protein